MMMITMMTAATTTEGTTPKPRRRHRNLPARDGGRAKRARPRFPDFSVASRGFGVVPSVVVAAVIIVIIIIRMDHEHPRRDINIIPGGPQGVPGDPMGPLGIPGLPLGSQGSP